PVIPISWEGFRVTRQYRGVCYEISVTRQGAGNSVALVVDGVPQEGTVVPHSDGATTRRVEVFLS
ncbi:MAG TPA: hypothetical protein VH744_10410, partial [Terriglobales bacterium]